MLRLLLKHKLLYIVTLTVAVFITASIYFYIDSQVRDDTVTVGFVDASAATIGSYDLISQAFAPEARNIHITRAVTDVYVTESYTPADSMEDALLKESADILLLEQFNRKLLAAAGKLEPVSLSAVVSAQEAELGTYDGVCYGIVLDGVDLTGKGDAFYGYKTDEPSQCQYFCAAVLARCNNKDAALDAVTALGNRIAQLRADQAA